MSAFSQWWQSLTARHPRGDAPVQAPPEPEVTDIANSILGNRYQLRGISGRGAASIVFFATDLMLDLPVAVKVLLPGGLYEQAEPGTLDLSLRRESRAALLLSHPNLLNVYHYEREGDVEFIVMEVLAGESLARVCRQRPTRRLTQEELVDYIGQALAGLSHAHAHGVVHNDLKPGNLLLSDGVVKVCDFGLAEVGHAQACTLAAGTPAYMSPERIRGEAGTPRTDVYAMGATIFALSTGFPPFGGQTEVAVAGHLHRPIPRVPIIPNEIFDVIWRAMAKDPQKRQMDAEELLLDLGEAAAALSLPLPAAIRGATAVPATRHAAPSQKPEVRHQPDENRPPTTGPTVRPGRPPPAQPTTMPAPMARSTAPAPMPTPAVATPIQTARAPRHTHSPEGAPGQARTPTMRGAAIATTPAGTPLRGTLPTPLGRLAHRVFPEGQPQPVPDDMVALDIGGRRLLMNRHPVTNREFARFVAEAAFPPPCHWPGSRPAEGTEDHPVVNVSLEDARAYAKFVGRRVPTEAEWDAALAGSANRRYPWGDTFEPHRCRGRHLFVAESVGPSRSSPGTAPVGSHPGGATPEGVEDLLGHVWEWTEGEGEEDAPVRGGSFRDELEDKAQKTRVSASHGHNHLGFRCVLD